MGGEMYLDNSEIASSCMLCERGIFGDKFPIVIQKALMRKYCVGVTSVHFLKPITKILKQKK